MDRAIFCKIFFLLLACSHVHPRLFSLLKACNSPAFHLLIIIEIILQMLIYQRFWWFLLYYYPAFPCYQAVPICSFICFHLVSAESRSC